MLIQENTNRKKRKKKRTTCYCFGFVTFTKRTACQKAVTYDITAVVKLTVFSVVLVRLFLSILVVVHQADHD